MTPSAMPVACTMAHLVSEIDPNAPHEAVREEEYQWLLAFRTELRAFLHWSEQKANDAGLTPSIHQLMLVIRGFPADREPTVGEAAEMLYVRHHSVVELAQRAEQMGLVKRERDPGDQRRVHLSLTEEGRRRLESITRETLVRVAALSAALEKVVGESRATLS